MDDTLREVLTDILAYLENGLDLQATSIIHDDLKRFATPFIDAKLLAKRIQEIKEDMTD